MENTQIPLVEDFLLKVCNFFKINKAPEIVSFNCILVFFSLLHLTTLDVIPCINTEKGGTNALMEFPV